MATAPRGNPYDYIHPVTDASLFAGRDEELKVIEEHIATLAVPGGTAPIIALFGERRVGKTSLLCRISELCIRLNILPVSVDLTTAAANDAWEFWYELFGRMVESAVDANFLSPDDHSTVGFRTSSDTAQAAATVPSLRFQRLYESRSALTPSPLPPSHVVKADFDALCGCLVPTSCAGILVLFDEAHLLLESTHITQQFRHVIHGAPHAGAVFAGEPALTPMFVDRSQPFYAQARVIPVVNFSSGQEVSSCALLPLAEEERALMSPTTVDYLSRLTRGKPNQIRLVCNSIYRRFQRGEQTDLDISIEALDEVLQNIASAYSGQYDLQRQVEAIRRLSSVDLEALYDMTRFPRWSVEDVIDLDESFRGETRSDASAARRRQILERKRAYFVRLGLMDDEPDKYALAGDEFLYLYLAFWYEVRKYGELSRRLELGKAPPTVFSEKVHKLVLSLSWEVKRFPGIVMASREGSDSQSGEVVAKVRDRFDVLSGLMSGDPSPRHGWQTALPECFQICELVRTPGYHYLIVLSVRNVENPRESMQTELYFESVERPFIIPWSLIQKQCEAARLWIEELDSWVIDLPDLPKLLSALGGTVDQLVAGLGMLERWHLSSVQHFLGRQKEHVSSKDDGAGTIAEEEEHSEWIALYRNGQAQDALEVLDRKLGSTDKRQEMARLFNDRGYIRYGLNDVDGARSDLERALQLHFHHLPVTLMNLSVAAIDAADCATAIKLIEDALLITHTRESIAAGFLRLRTRGTHLHICRHERWEEHPANVLEAAYVNLSYAVLQLEGLGAAAATIQEGLALMPSSFRLKHALARAYLFNKRADLADPLYRELSDIAIPDDRLANEVRSYVRLIPGRRRH